MTSLNIIPITRNPVENMRNTNKNTNTFALHNLIEWNSYRYTHQSFVYFRHCSLSLWYYGNDKKYTTTIMNTTHQHTWICRRGNLCHVPYTFCTVVSIVVFFPAITYKDAYSICLWMVLFFGGCFPTTCKNRFHISFSLIVAEYQVEGISSSKLFHILADRNYLQPGWVGPLNSSH